MPSPLRILHLEDDAKDAELLQALLESEDITCHITRVDTQADFVAAIEHGGFDLILADHTLPSFDGFSALKITLDTCPAVPFIFVSGTLGEEVAIEALKIGATDYVLKERLSRIVPSVQRALREAQERAERKRVEQALRESEEQWRAAFESNPTMYFMIDGTGTIVSVNPFGAEQLGYTVDELVGYPVLQVFYEPDREAVQRHADMCFAQHGQTMRWEARKLRKDGTMLWVRETAKAVLMKNQPVLLVVCEDITERRHAEEALRRSEAYLEEAQRLTQTGSWAWNVATREYVYWLQELSRLFGFDPEGGIPSFEAVLQRIHPEDRDKAVETIERAIRERMDFEVDYRTVLPDGTMKYLHSVAHAVFNTSGELVELLGTTMDVTERKRAEEERQAHLGFLENMERVNQALQGTNDLEQMLRDVLDAVLSIFDCDRAWLVYPCDPAAPSWRPVMEQTRSAFPGAFALGSELPIDPADAEVFRSARAANGPVHFGPGADAPVPGQLGERFSVQSVIAMAVYPKWDRPYLFGIHYCSHPRAWTAEEERLFQAIGRRLEDALTSLLMLRSLRESERRLEEAQRIAHVGYWDSDLDTDFVTWSEETYRIFGLSPEERLLSIGRVQELIHADDRPTVVRAVAAARRGGPRYEAEYRVVRPDGEVRIVHSQSDVLRDEADQPRRIFGTIQDITERKRAEEALREAQAELAHINRVTTLGELTASIAHEVNQPLAAVTTNATAALRWLGADSPHLDEARECLRRIVRDGARAGEVITRLRALAKKAAPARALVDLTDTVQEVLALVTPEARRHHVAVRMELAPTLPPVQGDRVQLQQVLLNLALNGIEATWEVTERPRELVIRAQSYNEGTVLVAVQDNGIGLDAQTLGRLFEAFYTTKPDGLGMGLSISRSIIEAHGGRLWATQNEPRGAVFQFTLPSGGERVS